VHAVHAAWPVRDAGAPWWSRYRARHLKHVARRRERAALSRARVVIANSHATRRALIEQLGIAAERVRTVYLGSDPSWGPADRSERLAARLALGVGRDVPVVAFVGALGADINKGFDRVWDAWRAVHASGTWDGQLIVAGGGWRLRAWREEVQRTECRGSVHFLGFTTRIREVLAAADLLVSPVRYEAYGLNVHEALCRGVPVMVTRTAGVAERFDAAMWDALLPDHVTSASLAERLRAWRMDMEGWRSRSTTTACRLRAYTWDDMAADIVRTIYEIPQRIPA
jgi:glycosyltransferase involved in cell wall biosynthesis